MIKTYVRDELTRLLSTNLFRSQYADRSQAGPVSFQENIVAHI